jgi:hypothetical protein
MAETCCLPGEGLSGLMEPNLRYRIILQERINVTDNTSAELDESCVDKNILNNTIVNK